MARILVADYQPDILYLVDALLSMQGHQIKTAPSKKDFLPLLVSFTPELIILDVMLGPDNGRDICREIKAAAQQHIPILLYSANPDLLSHFEECAADDVLDKPFEIKTLLEKVSRLLSNTK